MSPKKGICKGALVECTQLYMYRTLKEC